MRHRMSSTLLTTSALLLLCGSAVAEPRNPPPPPLGGPPVHDRDVPGTGNTFGEPMPGENPKATPRVAPRVFFDALRSLNSDQAPPPIRPTPEQRDELHSIIEEFKAEARAFRDGDQNRTRPPERENRRPRPERDPRHQRAGDAPPPPPRGDQPGPPPPSRDDDRRPHDGARGPNPDGYYARIWDVLNDEQQAFLRDQLDAAQRERMMKREEPIARDGVRRKLSEIDPALRGLDGLSREEVRARLRDLPPEKRDEIIGKLLERRERNGPPPKDRRPEDRPPPDMDKVDVPKAE